MAKWVWLVFGLACAQARAGADWFTVSGDPRNPAVDTVQVDPMSIADADGRKTMNVRVSRSARRTNWDGVPYRSYTSQVAFDCDARRAEYLSASFYMAPLWAGASHSTGDYAADPKPMLFRDVQPNPVERIVRAACRLPQQG